MSDAYSAEAKFSLEMMASNTVDLVFFPTNIHMNECVAAMAAMVTTENEVFELIYTYCDAINFSIKILSLKKKKKKNQTVDEIK